MTILQPLLFEPHPAYRAQIDHLDGLEGYQKAPVLPRDRFEHSRWLSKLETRWRRLQIAWLSATYRPDRDALVYISGTFPKIAHGLVNRCRVHLDPGDPLSVLEGGGRGQIPGEDYRRQALYFLNAFSRNQLSLSFWSQVQLANFLANLRFDESRPWLESGRLFVLPPAIAPWDKPRAAVGSNKALRILGIASGKFWPKGIPDAIAACELAIKAGVDLQLTLVGGGIPKGKWHDYISSRGWIRNLGHVERSSLETEFARSDVLIFPSHHDTYGWVIVEAKRYGVPTIATDFYSRSEVISHEIDGLLVRDPFENPFFPISNIMYGEAFFGISDRGELIVGEAIADYVRQLADAIRRLAEDRLLLSAMGENARASTIGSGSFSVATRLARLKGILGAHAR